MAKREVRLSNKGRNIKTPRKILTSDDNETPKRKNFKSLTQMKAEINRVQSLATQRGPFNNISSETDKEGIIKNRDNLSHPSTSGMSKPKKTKSDKSKTLTTRIDQTNEVPS